MTLGANTTDEAFKKPTQVVNPVHETVDYGKATDDALKNPPNVRDASLCSPSCWLAKPECIGRCRILASTTLTSRRLRTRSSVLRALSPSATAVRYVASSRFMGSADQ